MQSLPKRHDSTDSPKTLPRLTDRQLKVLDFIRTQITRKGYPPTLREIGNHMGIRSTNGVNDHLRALERKGYLTREDMKSRTLRPTDLPDAVGAASTPGVLAAPIDDDLIEVPILGRVAAGLPAEAIEHPEDTVRVSKMLLGRGAANGTREVFGLRITGESMIEAGILDGDFVFVRKQVTADRGDIVIAMVGDEATCKYFYPEREHIRLQPANARMAPILVPKNDWRGTQILGVVVGVYRRLA